MTDGAIFMHADGRGAFSVSMQGHVYVPLSLRRWCGLGAGDQVLLVGDVGAGRLTIYPSRKLDPLFADATATAIGDGR